MALWFHVRSTKSRVYLLVSSILWCLSRILRLLAFCYQRLCGNTCKFANIYALNDALQVHIKVPRSWKIRAGQFIYLCVPGLSSCSWIQSHPFTVVWWYLTPNDELVIVLLVEVKKGFTKKLMELTQNNRPTAQTDNVSLELAKRLHPPDEIPIEDEGDYTPEELRAIQKYLRNQVVEANWRYSPNDTIFTFTPVRASIRGPYGCEKNFRNYGSILMFATGIGIAGQLPYIKRLFEDRDIGKTQTQKIFLYWEIESECGYY